MPVLSPRSRGRRRAGLAVVGALALAGGLLPMTASADADPRVGLEPSYLDGPIAASNMELLENLPRAGAFNAAPGNFSFVNSDLAFSGDNAIVGSYNGFQVYDVSDPAAPALRSSFVCPGGQGDVSVFGDLLFMSVEETRGRIDCGTATPNATTRFRGVRIFDISNIDAPVQLPGIQSCKGSHTHTIVEDPDDAENIYVYISGTSSMRPAAEPPFNCSSASSLTDRNTDNFSITVFKVPLAAPETATIVNRNARIFSTCGDNTCEGDHASGALNNFPQSNPQPLYPVESGRAPGGQSASQASTCHDITAYPEIGLAAGACQGRGLLLDISDPVNPKRIDAVEDFNFAYWHSATFNNDGTKVIFTDEWGGGTGARCRPTDPMAWGANALFDIVDGKMQFASYYKIPAPQTAQENCVAHNGSLVPVPGRDILVQAWYQGGVSVIDFTDTKNPKEIAFLDRGPVNTPSATGVNLAGYWSTYWYNGHIYGSEIARGFDSLALTPSEHLSANEIAAASEVTFDEFNAQAQPRYDNTSITVVRAYIDQAVRAGTLSGSALGEVTKHVNQAEKLTGNGAATRSVQAQLDNAAKKAGSGNGALVDAINTYRASL